MPRMSGLEMLRRAKQNQPETCALIITDNGTIESAIGALEEESPYLVGHSQRQKPLFRSR